MGGSGDAVVGSAVVFRTAGWIACMGDYWSVFGLRVGSGDVRACHALGHFYLRGIT